jgi:hypothetical protein
MEEEHLTDEGGGSLKKNTFCENIVKVKTALI